MGDSLPFLDVTIANLKGVLGYRIIGSKLRVNAFVDNRSSNRKGKTILSLSSPFEGMQYSYLPAAVKFIKHLSKGDVILKQSLIFFRQ